jgi:hypothetical protein
MIAGNRCEGSYMVALVVIAVVLLSFITLLIRRREHRTKILERPASLFFIPKSYICASNADQSATLEEEVFLGERLDALSAM